MAGAKRDLLVEHGKKYTAKLREIAPRRFRHAYLSRQVLLAGGATPLAQALNRDLDALRQGATRGWRGAAVGRCSTKRKASLYVCRRSGRDHAEAGHGPRHMREQNDVVISGGVAEGGSVALGVQKLDPSQKVRCVVRVV